MEEKLKRIINYYGPRKQLKKLVEEVFEFVEAVIDYEKDWESSDTTRRMIEQDKEHMEEECSDVMVMVSEYVLYYGLDRDKIKEIMEYKIDRQIVNISYIML